MSNTLRLVEAAACSDADIETAACALHAQWPRGGSVADYVDKICPRAVERSSTASDLPVTVSHENIMSQTLYTLPCSYLLIEDKIVIGHGRLTECFEGAGGRAAAATYIVIHEPQRGRGYGSQLMSLLEQKSVDLGYHYVYLWTTMAIPFYIKIGYSRTERVSLFSACLKTLECNQVSKLEAMLSKRSADHRGTITGIAATAQHKQHETVMLPPDASRDKDVWLRKRLVEHVPPISVAMQERIRELRAAIKDESLLLEWDFCLHSIPWQQQVGPSCGLAALRMLRDYYHRDSSRNDTVEEGELGDTPCRVVPMPSLLTEAQSKGYTVDGEIFDANNLLSLALFCGLDAKLWSFVASTPAMVLDVLREGGTVVIPYDSQPSTKRPCRNSGRTAHYGIIVGMLLGYSTKDEHNEQETATLIEGIRRPIADARTVHLLVQHSLSPKLAIAQWSDFFKSNQQLVTMDEKKYRLVEPSSTLNLKDCLVVCLGKV